MRFEVHVHTKYSKDSILCFWPLYIICRIKHIDGIAITEHNNIEGAVEFKKFCQKHGDKINVIIGDEIFTTHVSYTHLYPYREQYYAAGNNGSNNADVGGEK